MTFEDHIKKKDMTGDQKASLHKRKAYTHTHTHTTCKCIDLTHVPFKESLFTRRAYLQCLVAATVAQDQVLYT